MYTVIAMRLVAAATVVTCSELYQATTDGDRGNGERPIIGADQNLCLCDYMPLVRVSSPNSFQSFDNSLTVSLSLSSSKVGIICQS